MVKRFRNTQKRQRVKKPYAESRSMDKQRKAKKPGKRISKNGNRYYEYRVNRADRDRRKRL